MSRENFFGLTPLLFEACSGRLEQRPADPRRAAAHALHPECRIVLDWTVALFFRPDITKVELRVEREQVRRPHGIAAVAGGRNERRE